MAQTLVRLTIVTVSLLLGGAMAQGCLRPVTVTTSALGAEFRAGDQALADAVTAALNQAITQVRGVYVTSRQEIWSEFRDGILNEGSVDEISSRFSGFVPDYRVVSSTPIAGGGVEVTVEVTVCLDERIAFGLEADATTRDALLSALSDGVAAAGWRVVMGAPTAGASDTQLMDYVMANGVTYLARGSSSTSFGSDYGFETATVTLSLNLFDTRTFEVAHSLALTVAGSGSTRDAALQDAAAKVGNEIARAWNREFLDPQDRQTTDFVFHGVNRSGTRYSLEEIASRLGGVLSVISASYDASRGEVRLEVEIADDPCRVARDLPTYRRVITELQSCTPTRAVFRVLND